MVTVVVGDLGYLHNLNTSNYHSSKKLTYALGVDTNRRERS